MYIVQDNRGLLHSHILEFCIKRPQLYQNCWQHTDTVCWSCWLSVGPAIWSTWAVCELNWV